MQSGSVYLYLSRVAYYILHLADKYGITITSIYIHTNLNMAADYLLWVELVLEWHLLPHIAQAAFQLCGQLKVDLLTSLNTNQCQHYSTFENPTTSGCLGVECFQPYMDVSGEL